MEREAICPVCGKTFTARRALQKYCSAFCRRYAYRHGCDMPPPRQAAGKRLRAFHCLRCGKLVVVTQQTDRRTKFCSTHCERLYWKHSQKVKSQAVAHAFSCRQCGKLVAVTDAKDRRTAFCSAACRKEWFALYRKGNKKT